MLFFTKFDLWSKQIDLSIFQLVQPVCAGPPPQGPPPPKPVSPDLIDPELNNLAHSKQPYQQVDLTMSVPVPPKFIESLRNLAAEEGTKVTLEGIVDGE